MIEWEHLALYCQSDADFFTSPELLDDEESRLAVSRADIPEGWSRTERDLWIRLNPHSRSMVDTGWKIHITATPSNVERVCDVVWRYCIDHNIAFKFLRSRRALQLMNSKYADRSASGKAVAVYPSDERELEHALVTLGRLLEGVRGPYILSDLRIGVGPIFVRYGAFTRLTCIGSDGEPVPARRSPDGSLVPDIRDATFVLPDDVEAPDILRPHIDALAVEDDPVDFPFVVEEALHYSNSGGVYVATHADTGERLILVEGRPYAGLDRNGRDCVTRLAVQRDTLQRLAGLSCVPRLIGYHVAWEHHFLAEEYIEGLTLFEEMVRRYPYAHNAFGPPDADTRAYAEWVAEVISKIGRAIDEVHARGVRFGDLHPSNIIVRPDGQVVLVDFEYSRDLEDTTVLDGGAPGFHAPPGIVGPAADRYQLECIRIWLHLPMNLRPEHTPAQLRRAMTAVTELFPVDETFVNHLSAGLALDETHTKPDVADALLVENAIDWSAIRDSLVAGIMKSADPARRGVLFPGSPPQFSTGGFTLAYGAAGVLLALHRVKAEIPEEFVDWMIEQAETSRDARPGLYDGLHGVAYVLDELGYADAATSMLRRARAVEERVATNGMLGGRAGHGLNLLHFAQRLESDDLFAGAVAIGEQLVQLMTSGELTATLQGPLSGGLMRGMSGVALFLLRLFEATADPSYLDHARKALGYDLDRGEFLGGETFQLIDHGTRRRNILYLDGGSTGLAIVAHEYLTHRPDEQLAAAVVGVRRGCRARFVRGPGLFRGRAGFIASLACLNHPDDHEVLLAHVPKLAMHAQPFRGHLAFPSTKLLRLSMDLATGSAGILLALTSAFGGNRSFLPYVDSRMR